MRYFILNIVLLTLFSTVVKAGQADSTRVDSAAVSTRQHLPVVTINANRQQQYEGDTHVEEISRQQLRSQVGSNLGQFLQAQTAVNIKAYGSGGGLSTVSLRGANASQTLINWNGFPINSITTGTADLSMVPTSGFQNISIAYGASGTLYGSGSFGGAINLNNEARFENHTTATVYDGYNSLGTHTPGAQFSTSGTKAAYSASIWSTHSTNEFDYYDYIKQTNRTQTDGDWDDAGFMQNAAFKVSKTTVIEAGMWYQNKKYQIPSRIGSTTYEFQNDSALRLYVSLKQAFKHSALEVKVASFMQQLNYWQKSSASSTTHIIDSKIKGNQLFADISYHQRLSNTIVADAGFVASQLAGHVTAYGATQYETHLSPFVGLQWKYGQWQTNVSWRYEWSADFAPKNLLSAGVIYHSPSEKWLLRANVSQKYRQPSFNDRYWQPGGDLTLKPESGNSVEVGGNIIIASHPSWNLSSDVSLYYYIIKNMIVWKPSSAYWTAQNYQKVNSKGAEINLKFATCYDKINYISRLNANFNHSVIAETQNPDDPLNGHTMPYSPRIITSWYNAVTYKQFGCELWHHFTADRYVDETMQLDPYQTFSMSLYGGFNLSQFNIKLSAQCDNLFDENYELIRLYPMPGRTYTFRIFITI